MDVHDADRLALQIVGRSENKTADQADASQDDASHEQPDGRGLRELQEPCRIGKAMHGVA